jgi:hypothetical protein
MKIKIILLLHFFSSSVSGQITFQKLFGHSQSNVAEYVYDACIDLWGNMYVSGANSLNTFNLAKIDSNGTICWNKTISQFYAEGTNILFSSDSNIVLSGRSGSDPLNSYIYIMKTDTAASVIWSAFVPLDSMGGVVKFLNEDLQGNFIMGGYKPYYNLQIMQIVDKAFILKFSNTGNFTWYKEVSDSNSFYFSDCDLLTNNYLILGSKSNSTLGNSDILLTEIDTNGVILRTKVYGSSQNDYGEKIIKKGNTFILACVDENSSIIPEPHFIQIDSAFNINLNKKILSNSSSIPLDVGIYKQNSLINKIL